MRFEEYLREKNIDPIKFQSAENELYLRFESEFLQMHPNSFTSQKKFFINDLRRRFQLTHFNQTAEPEVKETATKSAPKPVFKRPS
jgi:hypothetical protein